MIGRVRDEYGSCLDGSSGDGQGGEITGYFQVCEVGLTDRLDVEGQEKRGTKSDA